MASLHSYLKEDIRRRYFIADETPYVANKIIDELCLKKTTHSNNITSPRDAYVISEWFSNAYGIRQLPFKMMLQTFNISDKHLKELVLAVKRKHLNFVFAGFGGTGVNTMYWLEKILDHTNDVYLFESIEVVDDDKVDFTNLLRFPKDFSSRKANLKVELFNNKSQLSRNPAIKLHDRFVPVIISNNMPNIYSSLISYVASDDAYKATASSNTIIYGAPDLETRGLIAQTDLNFIAATHGNNSCAMTVSPEIDENIQTEGYGVIHLNTFFWNQLAMTIGLLEFLASDDHIEIETPLINSDGTNAFNLDGTYATTQQSVSKWDQEGQIFKFNFEEFVDNNQFGKATKKLDFNLTKDTGVRNQ